MKIGSPAAFDWDKNQPFGKSGARGIPCIFPSQRQEQNEPTFVKTTKSQEEIEIVCVVCEVLLVCVYLF